MKKLLVILSMVLTLGVSAQTYVNVSGSVYNGIGSFSERTQPSLEVGKTWDNLSVGLQGGVTAFSKGKAYLELRPTVVIFSKGPISVSGTLGAGYLFDTPEHFLTEYCGSVNYTINKNWSFSTFAGGYHFDGENSTSKYTFVGTGLTYSFVK